MADEDMEEPTILYTLEAVQDSDDLGIDKGTT